MTTYFLIYVSYLVCDIFLAVFLHVNILYEIKTFFIQKTIVDKRKLNLFAFTVGSKRRVKGKNSMVRFHKMH